jgi:hypothetical protein
LYPAAFPAPLTKVGSAVDVVAVAVAVVLGVTVVTMTVVQVDVLPFEVTVVMQVEVEVVGAATQMLCLQTQAHGYRPLQSESTMQPSMGGGGTVVVVKVVACNLTHILWTQIAAYG